MGSSWVITPWREMTSWGLSFPTGVIVSDVYPKFGAITVETIMVTPVTWSYKKGLDLGGAGTQP